MKSALHPIFHIPSFLGILDVLMDILLGRITDKSLILTYNLCIQLILFVKRVLLRIRNDSIKHP